MGANIALSGAMATTSETMNQMNKIMQPDKIAGDMRAFQQANMKMEMTDEMSEFFLFFFFFFNIPHFHKKQRRFYPIFS